VADQVDAAADPVAQLADPRDVFREDPLAGRRRCGTESVSVQIGRNDVDVRCAV